MKAKDLRLGNTVQKGFDVIKVAPVDIAAQALADETGQKHLMPVRLTNEKLIELGFYESVLHEDFMWIDIRKGHSHISINLKLGICSVAFGKFLVSSPRVEYEHELENLYFALTGEEIQ